MPNKNNPQYANSCYNSGCVKSDLGDTHGACEDWTKVAELGDEDAALLVEEHCQ